MDTLLQDIRYSLRKLARTPGFTFVAVATLALAIGATTAVFSVVDAVLLRPLPFAEPAQLMRIGETNRDGRPFPLSALDYIDYRDQNHSFVGMAPLDNEDINLTAEGAEPLRLTMAMVGARFFELLGVKPQMGRGFATNEDSVGAPRVVVISQGLWQTRFGSDASIVGQTIQLDNNPYTVIGVAPASLTFPSEPDVWVPLQWSTDQLDPSNRGAHGLWAIGRLKPGVTRDAGYADLSAIAARLAKQYPESNTNFGANVTGLQEQIVGDVENALYAMLGAVACVLLIACANVANLLLVRAATRESEIAVRTALGAARGRIVRQLVTESVILAGAGAVFGAAMAAWAVDAVVALGPTSIPRLNEVAVNGRVLLFTAIVAAITGVAFGLVPALHAVRPDLSQMLRESVRGTTRGGLNRTRNILVVTEMALAVVLLVGAGLLARSFVQLTNVDPGFRAENVVTFNLSLPTTKYQYDRDVRTFTANLLEQLRALPGTQSAGVTFGRPLGPNRIGTIFDVVGRPENPPDRVTVTDVHAATPDYFSAAGMSLIRGRLYDETENRLSEHQVLVVNDEFVRRYFPTEDPIGKRITLGIAHDSAGPNTGVTANGEIIGIVKTVKQEDLAEDFIPAVYVPFNTLPFGALAVLIRSTSDLATVQRAAREVVRSVDPNLPVYGMQTMEESVSESVAQPRLYMVLLGAFAGIALLLAALGIYGVISYGVSQRQRELGIRIALGASRDRVVRLVLGQGLLLTVSGVAIGVLAALLLTRVIQNLLFGVSALDPLTFAGVAVLLLGVASLASYVPARRAAGVDPVVTMRTE